MFYKGVLNSRIPSRVRAQTRTGQIALRDTQVRSALSHAHAHANAYQKRTTYIL
jgi:hypothetical protein